MQDQAVIKMLDLVNHTPEEYSGKAITIGGCPYMLGDALGSGTEKYVYLLRNMRTGLFHHVLKIHRGPEAGRSLVDVLMMMERLKGELDSTGRRVGPDSPAVMPDIMPVKWPGGQMHIQVNLGPREPEGSLTRDAYIRAKNFYTQGRWSKAVAALDKVFARNPNHSDAVSLLGDIRAAQGNQAASLTCIASTTVRRSTVL